jgi:hypothetical protein
MSKTTSAGKSYREFVQRCLRGTTFFREFTWQHVKTNQLRESVQGLLDLLVQYAALRKPRGSAADVLLTHIWEANDSLRHTAEEFLVWKDSPETQRMDSGLESVALLLAEACEAIGRVLLQAPLPPTDELRFRGTGKRRKAIQFTEETLEQVQLALTLIPGQADTITAAPVAVEKRKGKAGRRGYPKEIKAYGQELRAKNPLWKPARVRAECLKKFENEDNMPVEDGNFRRWLNR